MSFRSWLLTNYSFKRFLPGNQSESLTFIFIQLVSGWSACFHFPLTYVSWGEFMQISCQWAKLADSGILWDANVETHFELSVRQRCIWSRLLRPRGDGWPLMRCWLARQTSPLELRNCETPLGSWAQVTIPNLNLSQIASILFYFVPGKLNKRRNLSVLKLVSGFAAVKSRTTRCQVS